MRQIYETGRGSFKLRAKYELNKKENIIEVLEIPYPSTVEGIIDDISELIKSGKIKEIIDVRDETDLKGLKLCIDYRKSQDPHLLMQKLYKLTGLEASFSCNFNILTEGRARVLSVREILYAWLDFRRSCLKKEFKFDLEKLKEKYHLLTGLEKIILDIDEAIKIIRNTKKDAEVISRLMEHFNLDNVQANYVADIRLRHINEEYLLLRLAEKNDLLQKINELEDLLAHREKLDRDN